MFNKVISENKKNIKDEQMSSEDKTALKDLIINTLEIFLVTSDIIFNFIKIKKKGNASIFDVIITSLRCSTLMLLILNLFKENNEVDNDDINYIDEK